MLDRFSGGSMEKSEKEIPSMIHRISLLIFLAKIFWALSSNCMLGNAYLHSLILVKNFRIVTECINGHHAGFSRRERAF